MLYIHSLNNLSFIVKIVKIKIENYKYLILIKSEIYCMLLILLHMLNSYLKMAVLLRRVYTLSRAKINFTI